MNVFVLSLNMYSSAESLCDKHLPKMVLETAQIACSAMRLNGIPYGYKLTHVNHPWVKWAAEDFQHLFWLRHYGIALANEYRRRYNKVHKSLYVLHDSLEPSKLMPGEPGLIVDIDSMPLCMPDQYKVPGDTVQSYRNYYIGEKASFARWTRTNPPNWWPKELSA